MWLSSTSISTGSRMCVFHSRRGHGLMLAVTLCIGVTLSILNHVVEARLGKQATTVQAGDMIFEKHEHSNLIEGGAAYARATRWPFDHATQKYIVPYDFSTATSSLLHRFNYVIRMLELGSNLQFRPRTPSDIAYLLLNSTASMCAATIGYTEGIHHMFLADSDCAAPGTMSHEIFHTLGFVHEHSRSDRMHHVELSEEVENAHNFKVSNSTNYTPYEHYSMMHYTMYNGSVTSRRPDIKATVRRAFPSVCDWHALNTRYPGPVKAPECVLNKLDNLVPSLAFRILTDVGDPVEMCKTYGDFRIFNRQCLIPGGADYPAMPWANHVEVLKSDIVSRPTRREFCRGFLDPNNRDKTIYCRRACNVGCPAHYSDLTLERCMATIYSGCKQRGSKRLP